MTEGLHRHRPELLAELRRRFAAEAATQPGGEVIAEMVREVQAGRMTWRQARHIDGYGDALYVLCAQVADDPDALSPDARARYQSAADALIDGYSQAG